RRGRRAAARAGPSYGGDRSARLTGSGQRQHGSRRRARGLDGRGQPRGAALTRRHRRTGSRRAASGRPLTVRPTPADLEAARARTAPDLLGPGLRLSFVGINPSLWTAAVGAHFARPGNRFWPAMYAAGLTAHLVDPAEGMRAEDADHVIGRG